MFVSYPLLNIIAVGFRSSLNLCSLSHSVPVIEGGHTIGIYRDRRRWSELLKENIDPGSSKDRRQRC
jgi:hypothetical protein